VAVSDLARRLSAEADRVKAACGLYTTSEPLLREAAAALAPSAAQVGREDMRILWKQIASRHAFAYNPEYVNEGSLDALIEFARIAAVALSTPSAKEQISAIEWRSILDAMDTAERECGGFVSDAHIRVRKKVEAAFLAAPDERRPVVGPTAKDGSK
jgi:predicted TIM-barrel enzyme